MVASSRLLVSWAIAIVASTAAITLKTVVADDKCAVADKTLSMSCDDNCPERFCLAFSPQNLLLKDIQAAFRTELLTSAKVISYVEVSYF